MRNICFLFPVLLACSSGAPPQTSSESPANQSATPEQTATAPTTFISPPASVPEPPATPAPSPPEGPVPATYPAPPPKTIADALGDASSLFPTGFSHLSLSWTAEDLVRERPWVIHEGRLTPQLAYIYREAAYDVGTGRGDNPWLIANTIFGAVEYHFQRDQEGRPIGPLHKAIFLFEVSLPKDAVQKIREAGDAKWGEHKTLTDNFQVNFDQWEIPDKGARVIFHYSPGGSIAESIEIISLSTPATRKP